MPVWHEAARGLSGEGKLRVVGIVEEQHPDRAALFLQWKRVDWPILVDPLNLIGASAVPLTFLVDEHGIVRDTKLIPERLREFVEASYTAPPPPRSRAPDSKGEPIEWMARGDTLFLRGANGNIDEAIEAYGRCVSLGGPPEGRFRLGVALRRRYDSAGRRPGDFQAAVDAWAAALRERPGQYIWRRRLEQYGPRLEKPYAFYNWVAAARAEIERRGEKPRPLRVEPRGSELAAPLSEMEASPGRDEDPDPQGLLPRDEPEKRLVLVEAVVVPPLVAPGKPARVHLSFRPDPSKKAHWNNEAGGLVVRLDPPPGLEVERLRFEAPPGEGEVSAEERTVDFEVRLPANAAPPSLELDARAFYFVCEDPTGVCYYLRRDVAIRLRVESPESSP